MSPGTKPDSHDNALFIGGCDIGKYWMTGAIDELALFSRALSADEVNELKDGIEGVLSVDPRGKNGGRMGKPETRQLNQRRGKCRAARLVRLPGRA